MYPLAQSPTQCPNVTNITLLGGTGLYCWLGTLSRTRTTGWGALTTTSAPRTARSDATPSRMPINTSRYSTNTGADRDGRKSTTSETSTLSAKSGMCFRRRCSTKLHFGFVRLDFQTVDGGLNGTDALHQVAGKPDMDWAPGQGLTPIGPPPSSPSHDVTNRFSVGDDVVLTKGAHSLHVGVHFTRVQSNFLAAGFRRRLVGFFAGLTGIALFPGFAAGGSLQGSPLVGFNRGRPQLYLYHPDRDQLSLDSEALLASELAEPLHPGRLENQ